jgi:hypothetical protein
MGFAGSDRSERSLPDDASVQWTGVFLARWHQPGRFGEATMSADWCWDPAPSDGAELRKAKEFPKCFHKKVNSAHG